MPTVGHFSDSSLFKLSSWSLSDLPLQLLLKKRLQRATNSVLNTAHFEEYPAQTASCFLPEILILK